MSGFRIQGEKLRRYRTQALLTQEQLAHCADCSDRVIRKAEAGGSLRYETIELIAQSLAKRGLTVTPDDLIAGNLRLVKQFMEAFDQHGKLLLRHFKSFDGGLKLNVAGPRDHIPFAGVWRGTCGLQQYLDHFFASFQRKKGLLKPTYLEADQEITVRFNDRWQASGSRMPTMWVNLHFVSLAE